MADDQLETESTAREHRLENLTKNDDWKTAKRLLAEKIQSMTSLLDIPEEDRKDPAQIEGRYLAAQLIVEWIGEIDGSEVPRDNDPIDPDSLRGILRIRQSQPGPQSNG